jgi:hypothetical protein
MQREQLADLAAFVAVAQERSFILMPALVTHMFR